MNLFSLGVTRRRTVDPAAGTTDMATTREASRQNEIDRAMGTRSSLTVPLVKTMGRNTHTVVRVEAMIAPVTCFVPWTAALGAGRFLPLRRNMFSITTMELSTSMPMPRERPDRVIMFRVSPAKYMRTMANRTDRGILMPTTMVGRKSRRNRARIMMASRAPMAMLFTISDTIIVI